jgi:hypothetical protein
MSAFNLPELIGQQREGSLYDFSTRFDLCLLVYSQNSELNSVHSFLVLLQHAHISFKSAELIGVEVQFCDEAFLLVNFEPPAFDCSWHCFGKRVVSSECAKGT